MDALFLDFDGTLVDIADRPDAVRVEPGLTETLMRLHERLGGALAVVSGRAIGTIDGFLKLPVDVAGLHGLEHRLRGDIFPCRPDEHPAMRAGMVRIEERFADTPGVLIEDKGCSFAVHWRLAPDRADECLDAVRALAAALGPAYRIQHGKAVAELLPARAGKGGVILRFMESAPYAGRRAIFIGDDDTDEHGFTAVNAIGGATVRVGPGGTCAQYRVATPPDLRRVLARWAAEGIDLAALEAVSA